MQIQAESPKPFPNGRPRVAESATLKPCAGFRHPVRSKNVVSLPRGLAPTHTEIAAKIGRSRQQVTNIIVERFGPSPAVVRRVLELSRAA